MTTRFISDSASDVREMEHVDFVSVPLRISAGRADYVDDENLDVPGMLRDLSAYKGRSGTSCPGIDSWLEAFGEADRIYVVTITSGLSGTFNSAEVAARQYLQTHPDAKVHVFDSLSTGPEERLLLEKLVELEGQGLSFEEVCRRGRAYLEKSRLFFTLASLHNLAQNGRVSKVVAAAVGVLGIRMLGTASPEGTLQPLAKCRGDKKLLELLRDKLKEAGYRGGKVRISHVACRELAQTLKAAILERYPGADVLAYEARGLCSYYAEAGGMLVGCEC